MRHPSKVGCFQARAMRRHLRAVKRQGARLVRRPVMQPKPEVRRGSGKERRSAFSALALAAFASGAMRRRG